MKRRTGGEIASCAPDNLINHLFPPPDVFMVPAAINRGVLKRGTVMAKDGETGICAPLETGGEAFCILAEDVDTGSVPAEQPDQAAELVSQFQSEYQRAGISVEGGKIVYKPTGDVDEKITHVIDGINYVWVGLSFTKPGSADVKAVTIKNGGKPVLGADGSAVINLEKDSEDVVGGNPVVYFPVAEAGGKELTNKEFDMTFEWKKETGEIVETTKFKAARFDGESVNAAAYRSGHFHRNALILQNGYELTPDDENNLRLAGIFLSDGI